jgi:hypothetical protein
MVVHRIRFLEIPVAPAGVVRHEVSTDIAPVAAVVNNIWHLVRVSACSQIITAGSKCKGLITAEFSRHRSRALVVRYGGKVVAILSVFLFRVFGVRCNHIIGRVVRCAQAQRSSKKEITPGVVASLIHRRGDVSLVTELVGTSLAWLVRQRGHHICVLALKQRAAERAFFDPRDHSFSFTDQRLVVI